MFFYSEEDGNANTVLNNVNMTSSNAVAVAQTSSVTRPMKSSSTVADTHASSVSQPMASSSTVADAHDSTSNRPMASSSTAAIAHASSVNRPVTSSSTAAVAQASSVNRQLVPADAHESFVKFVESSSKADEAFLAMQKKEKEVDPFLKSCGERMDMLYEANRVWARFKISEILYQAEVYQLNMKNSSNYNTYQFGKIQSEPYNNQAHTSWGEPGNKW